MTHLYKVFLGLQTNQLLWPSTFYGTENIGNKGKLDCTLSLNKDTEQGFWHFSTSMLFYIKRSWRIFDVLKWRWFSNCKRTFENAILYEVQFLGSKDACFHFMEHIRSCKWVKWRARHTWGWKADISESPRNEDRKMGFSHSRVSHNRKFFLTSMKGKILVQAQKSKLFWFDQREFKLVLSPLSVLIWKDILIKWKNVFVKDTEITRYISELNEPAGCGCLGPDWYLNWSDEIRL